MTQRPPRRVTIQASVPLTLYMHVAEEISLPCQPRVLALLMRELASDAPNMRRLHQLFGTDPVLAAQLLESANSSAYQMAAQIRSIPQALVLLGDRPLRTLLKKAQAGLTARSTHGIDMAEFARISHITAKRARSLAGITGLDGSVTYTAALLHALGQIILHQTQPADTALLNRELGLWDPRRPRLEFKHWGYSANSTTAALLRQWGLPLDMVTAVQGMEAPMTRTEFDPIAGLLHLAVWSVRTQHSGLSERVMADTFPVDVALALGVDVDVVLQQDALDWSQSMY